jgi:SAM-dependent methyltransferase
MKMEWYQVAFGELYPLVYPHRDVAEAARVAKKLAPYVANARPTLDVACGDGRYMCALSGAGADMYGVDLSEHLLGVAAKRTELSGRLVCGDMRALPFVNGAFGSAINMFTSFGYFEADADNAGVLAEIERVLASRGTFVMDFINAHVARGALKPRTQRTVRDATVDEERELSADGRFLVKRVRVEWPGRDAVEYAERVRLFGREELRAMLSGAGFDIKAEHGDYELGPFEVSSSPRLILICTTRSNA